MTLKQSMLPMSMETRKILDAKGNPLQRGSIVGMAEKGGVRSARQGLVIRTWSDLNGGEYTVPVFFNIEVPEHRFSTTHIKFPHPESMLVRDWDEKYRRECKYDDMGFLLEDGDEWEKCPRIVFFKPEELIVQEAWTLEALAKRVFKGNYHSLFGVISQLPQTPTAYQCQCNDCVAPATRMALWNAWGSVSGVFVCDSCFLKIHGLYRDGPPPLKKGYFTPDCTPISISV